MKISLLLLMLIPVAVFYGGTKKTTIWKLTAYCPCEECCGVWAKKGLDKSGNRVTASGHVIKLGDRFIAADKRFAFGQMFVITGYGRVPVLDRGGAIKGNKLDLYFDTHKEALNWGVQYFESE